MKTIRRNTGTWFTTLTLVTVALTIGSLASFISPAQGGHCFAQIDQDNKCKGLITSDLQRDDCCSRGSLAAAYSDHQLPRGMIYFVEALGHPIPCTPCVNRTEQDNITISTPDGRVKQVTMTDDKLIKCSSCIIGKMCLNEKTGRKMRCSNNSTTSNTSCKFNCNGETIKLGPVCGSDGRTYRNMCRLQRKVCRSRSRVQFAHNGSCNGAEREKTVSSSSSSSDASMFIVKSCSECAAPKTCLLDQHKRPFCLPCKINHCPDVQGSPVCGTDGVSYQSKCHLHQTACARGGSIQIAHTGLCIN